MNGNVKVTHRTDVRIIMVIVGLLAVLAVVLIILRMDHKSKPTTLRLHIPTITFCQASGGAVQRLAKVDELGKTGYYWAKLAADRMVESAPDAHMSADAQAFQTLLKRWPKDPAVVTQAPLILVARDIDTYCASN